MDSSRWLFGVVAVALAYLVVPPLFFIFYTALVGERGATAGSLTFEHFLRLAESLSELRELVWNSLVFAVGSAGFALGAGTLLAWLAERTNARFRTVAYISAYLSFGVPGIIKVIGWILLLGPKAGILNTALAPVTGGAPFFNLFSLPGMIVVEGFLWMPVVFLLMATPFRSMDPSLEEAAVVSGSSGWQVFKRVTLPLALPSALAVLILTFVRSLEAFEIPALIGIPAGIDLFTTQIYTQIRGGFLPKYGPASAYSILLMVLVALALIPYYALTRHTYKFATVTGKGFRPRRIDLRSWGWLGGGLLLLLPLLQILPLSAMVWASLLPFVRQPSWEALGLISGNNYLTAFDDASIVASVINSLAVSSTAATFTVLLTLVASWLVIRTRIRSRWLLDQLAMVPLVFPGIVMGVAVLKTYLALPLPVYGTIWILVLAFMARYLPFGMRFSYAGLLGIHRELEESAEVCGATWAQAARRIVIPLTLPALFAGWIYIFLITVRELSVALLLYSPGSQVISVKIWELWENGHVGELAAFSLAITSGTVLLSVVFQRLAHRYGLHV
ncbi:MAG: iron ABC transporter permease [Deltaproteobacteria bacterium]|nr:iron ABC transporter permease [Deltaproteobacteria bacterium]MBI2349245.1 iron ABC transporter permease [Deltaproteobacteria bacterium]MBI2991380.1 iron ABC transporter permease [Deltaproteobacteria bacterium]MBI3060785.1 iron ABC transporter permease [Deltaproteobacteria bacterium]